MLSHDLIEGNWTRAGLATARHLLEKLEGAGVPEEERSDEGPVRDDTPPPEGEELHLLREIEKNLASVIDGHDIDPKVKVILH